MLNAARKTAHAEKIKKEIARISSENKKSFCCAFSHTRSCFRIFAK
jgi:hypothetical protein